MDFARTPGPRANVFTADVVNRSGSVMVKISSLVEISSGSSTPRSQTRCTFAVSTTGKETCRDGGSPTTMANTT